jgi:4-hydroxy-3-polyprenylbenzoate decarboxylase
MLHIDFFVFVDADVDPLDARAVLEAVALHADPDADFHQFGTETMPKVPLNIYQTPDEKGDAQTGTSKAKTAKAYIDATTAGSDPRAPHEPTAESRARARAVLAAAGVDGVGGDTGTNGDAAGRRDVEEGRGEGGR